MGRLRRGRARVKDLDLDPTAFPNADALQADYNLGRLTVVTKKLGDTDGDGDDGALYAYGARSLSILNDQGEMVFDSGASIEKIIAARSIRNSGMTAAPTIRAPSPGMSPSAVTVQSRWPSSGLNGRAW